jgi:hypothetical protein
METSYVDDEIIRDCSTLGESECSDRARNQF